MDYFDNAMNKAKDVFDVACKKTDEIVTIQKLKFEIASLKHKRSKDLENLGKIYFKSLNGAETEDGEVEILVESIKEKNRKIKEMRQEIENAKSDDENEEES